MADKVAITVLGAGSYGTALAVSLARNGHPTLIWGHESDHIERLQNDRENKEFLPHIAFPELLTAEASLATCLASTCNVLLVVPSHVFAIVLQQIKPFLRPEHRIAWATKGLEAQTGRLLQEVAVDVLGENYPLAVISGPTFAMEVAKGLPTAVAVAGTDKQFTQDIADLFHNKRNFRAYISDDFCAVQLGGAVKNVIAIGAGLADGLGFGANARTALITRGLVELTRLGVALGAKEGSFMGMAGLGDLVLTCTDNQSRNRRFGLALGQGKGIEEAQVEIGQVVEGYRNTEEVYNLAHRVGIEMPICEQIYYVLYQGKAVKEAAIALLSRSKKEE
ncbi:NAD(P)H-dependent glycerol-3-phosphate dehydrogenase [Psychromonas antarctica]|jgi:glycerol-3-phosphate dehydrogenase (NAD(P)+)|uniref:NAD(P)H-dependent glycerol-3-phosphate dehydrogenase n=1 Tax=Psychromonas antarctica TaxID=67573 RepID=UPI001EE886EA|nr:NAD(P)H-dependent glycerol-3-phosphate dehydrogenase [Psychromonas antarctica]MCG6202177.1 NAD(P)H-dependent glycerol-3-phosphate dehydrogenase [Psychromonas antarctica]